jgi:hypothetical protein
MWQDNDEDGVRYQIALATMGTRDRQIMDIWRRKLQSLDRENKCLVERIFALEEHIRALGHEPPKPKRG